eukprot:5616998-Pyramimonas_sp.AAC.1
MEELLSGLGAHSAIPAGRLQQRVAKDAARREEVGQGAAPRFSHSLAECARATCWVSLLVKVGPGLPRLC